MRRKRRNYKLLAADTVVAVLIALAAIGLAAGAFEVLR